MSQTNYKSLGAGLNSATIYLRNEFHRWVNRFDNVYNNNHYNYHHHLYDNNFNYNTAIGTYILTIIAQTAEF
jgi:hypothetical protein